MANQTEDRIVALYRDSFPDFARMVRGMGGDLEGAKDAFHDALLIYMEREKAAKLDIDSSPKAYLLGTAKICFLHARKKGAALELPAGLDMEGLASLDAAEPEGVDVEERERSLMESLVRSGKKCLELLKAFYYDHCSMEDIATRFGYKGRRSATVQKYKCLEKVREEIKTTQVYAQ